MRLLADPDRLRALCAHPWIEKAASWARRHRFTAITIGLAGAARTAPMDAIGHTPIRRRRLARPAPLRSAGRRSREAAEPRRRAHHHRWPRAAARRTALHAASRETGTVYQIDTDTGVTTSLTDPNATGFDGVLDPADGMLGPTRPHGRLACPAP